MSNYPNHSQKDFFPLLRYTTLICLGLFLSYGLSAQNQFNIWIFGNGAGINFNGGPPVVYNGAVVNTTEGTASICDSTTGNLLFYTDGGTVWTNTHQVMPNGTGLTGSGTTTQSALIVAQPANPGIYYVISVPYSAGNTDFAYSIVNMNLNGGLGSVTLKNQFLYNGNSVGEKVTAVRHCNGVDWWIITHEYPGNNYLSWLLTSTGIAASPVISGAGTNVTSSVGKLGYLTPNNSGTRLASPIYNGGTCDIVDYDNSSGMVSNPIVLTGFTQDYGTVFSPNDQVLYITNFQSLRQFDLSSGVQATIQASMYNVTTESNWMRAMRLGPDGRIYVVREFQPFMGVISNPNTLGAGCSYSSTGFNLAPNSNTLGIANVYPDQAPTCIVLADDEIQLQAQNISDGMVRLDWEINSNFGLDQSSLVLQRSEDGTHWNSIDHIQPGDVQTTDSQIDQKPLPGINYYRLVMRDANSAYLHSNVATVFTAESGLALVDLYPNPNQGQVRVRTYIDHEGPLQLQLLNELGQVVLQQEVNGSVGTRAAMLDLSTFANGVYMLKGYDGKTQFVERIVKQ